LTQINDAGGVLTDSEAFLKNARQIKGLDVDLALKLMQGSAKLFMRALGIAEKIIPELIDKLNACLSDGDLNNYAITAHGLKGSMNSIGAAGIGAAAGELERASKAGDLEYCRENTAGFTAMLNAFHKELAKLCGEGAAKKEDESAGRLILDRFILKEKLKKAAAAADEFDSGAAFAAIEELSPYDFPDDMDKTLKHIKTALEAFECDKAAAMIHELSAII